jgi:outer membrane protein
MSDVRIALAGALFAAAWPFTAAGGPEPLTIRSAVDWALARDPALQAAEEAAAEAAAGVRMARSPFKPQFLLTTTPGVTTGLPLQVAGEPPSAAGARLRLMLWDPALKAEEAGAVGQSASAAGGAESARRDTIRRTVAAYARLWAAERVILAARRRAAACETIEERAAARGREGRETELDVRRAALEAARARHRLRAAESGRDLAAAELGSLLGLSGVELPALAEDPLAAVPDATGLDALPAALASDPALRALGEESRSAARAAGIEGSWFKPQVVAEARYLYVPPYYNYDQYFLKVDTNTASLGVSVVVPVMSGGLETARAAKARAKEERLRDESRAREEEIVRAVRSASADADLAGRELDLARQSAEVAGEALRVAKALEREGRGDPDGVPRAEIEGADADEAVARAAEALVGARLALLTLRGGLGALAAP